MKLCFMKHESCIKFDRVDRLKTLFNETLRSFMNTDLDRTRPIQYNMFYETFPNKLAAFKTTANG